MGNPDALPVGYHLFFTLLPVTLPDGSRAETPFQGPLRDGGGKVVRLPLGVDLAKVALESGRYRLVPVDGDGRQVDSAQPVEVVVPMTLTRNDPRTVVMEVVERAHERVARDPNLREQIGRMSRDTNALIHVQAQQGAHAKFEAVFTARTPAERESAIERMADDIIALYVEAARDDGLVRGDHPMPVSRAAIRALANAPLRCSLHAIRGAVARLDYADATARAICRLSIGVELPASELVDLLPGVGEPMVAFALTALASGDRAAAALQWVRAGAFPPGPLDNSCRANALFAAWRLGERTEVRHVIVPLALPGLIQITFTMRGNLFTESRALVCLLADELADPGLTEVVKRCGRVSGEVLRAAVEFADRAMGLSVEGLIAVLPPGDVAADETRPVARNALCPCGSGMKVKRCCGKEASTETAARAPGVSPRVPDLTIENVSKASLRDLGTHPLPSKPDMVPFVTDRFARRTTGDKRRCGPSTRPKNAASTS